MPGNAPTGPITKEWLRRELAWHERDAAEIKKLNDANRRRRAAERERKHGTSGLRKEGS